MPIIQGLEVRIESGGSFLPEHSTLEGTTTETENHATQYIEISPGATFSVYLMTTEAFEYERGDGLRVVVYFDDQRGVRYDLSKLQVQPFRKSTFTDFCEESKKWKRRKLAFGAVEHVPDDEVVTSQSKESVGQILVIVYRVHRFKKRRPAAPEPFSLSSGTATLPKKLLVEKGLSHVIAGVEETVCDPPIISHTSVLLPGSAGQPLRFTFLYRTRDMLEHLGCLPQTPHLLESDEEDETVDTSGSRAALVESDSNREEGSPAVVEVPANSGLTAEEEQELIEVEARSAVLHQKRKRADACPKHDTDLTPAEAVASQPHLPRALKRERREVVDLTMD